MASRLTDFTRINKLKFIGSTVEEDPKRFFDEVWKILHAMGCVSGKEDRAIHLPTKRRSSNLV